MIRTRTITAILLLALAPGALSACGKKGPLEQPSTTSSSTPATTSPEGDGKEDRQDEGTTAP